jgi:prepilin-type processing-associated H-X9-DG protein
MLPAATGAQFGKGWASRVYPYVKSIGAYTCPDDAQTSPDARRVVSFAFNPNETGASLASLSSPASTVQLCEITGCVADVSDPVSSGNDYSELANGGDAGGSGYLIWGRYETGNLGNPPRNRPADNGGGNRDSANPNGRHTDGSNFLLSDGHAKYLKAPAVSPGYNAAAADCGQDGSTGSGCSANGGAAAGTAALGGSPGFAATFSAM